jgi:two-component system OmpR family sensor kinase
MTLRLRLVLGLLTLLAVGLVAFGLATGTLYARSQYNGLDSQMRSSSEGFAREVDAAANEANVPAPKGGASSPGSGGGGPGNPGSGPRQPVPSGTYGLLLSSSGKVLYRYLNNQSASSATAKVPADVHASAAGNFRTVGSTSGSTRYRVLAIAPASAEPGEGGGAAGASGFNGTNGEIVLMITPMTNVNSSVTHLILIETVGGAILLLLVSAGAWIVLRRELRPLERMARSARTITAGDLSQRVSTSGPTEVGELGLALNTMLGDIELAFREREATEQRLRQFLADASHELRTPLTSIQGFAELFRVGGAQAQVDLPTILRRIEQEASRMALLVEDLLMLARLDQSRPIERLPVDLAVLAADACSDLVALAPERTIRLDAPEPIVVRGDQHHLRQALTNLAVNAVRYTPEGSPIEVSARREGRNAIVSVRDHGSGLSEEAKAKVFDRFWQADRARVGPGVGLGLAIVAGIAAEHGGRAEVENAPLGGAVFSLVLPLPA